VPSVEKVPISHIVTNVFHKKFIKNNRIIQYHGRDRDAFSPNRAGCRKSIEKVESPSR